MSDENETKQKKLRENQQNSHFEKRHLNTEIDEEFICTICMDVMKNPLMIDICEHIYCGDCIKNCISHNSICPNDRIEIREANLKTPLRSFLNLLGKLDIKCEFTALGCNEIVKMDRLNNHMENCRFNPLNKIECICGERIDKVIADEHKNNCVINLRYQLEALKIENETLNKKLNEKVSVNQSHIFGVNRHKELKINSGNANRTQNLERNSPAACVWMTESYGSIPDSPIIGGYDIGGETIYIGRALHESDTIPGKIVPSHKCCYVAHGGKEHSYRNYQALSNPNGCSLVWIRARNGQVPYGAVQGGRQSDGQMLYIGRAKYEGSMIIGKVHPNHRVLYIPFGGNEISINKYEVLVCNEANEMDEDCSIS